jgi:hypothetical protein
MYLDIPILMHSAVAVCPRQASIRGQCALVTAACPRRYLRDSEQRKAQNSNIPEDFTKEEFLRNFRSVFGSSTTVKLEKATCHDEPHKRYSRHQQRRERHRHIALKASAAFAHKKIAKAFHKKYGVHIHFSFKQNRFGGYLRYLMVAGKKTSTDLDLSPACYPANLDVKAELKAAPHPAAAQPDLAKKKGRKGLTFDDVSNIIIEGIGGGPLRTIKAFEGAAYSLKQRGIIDPMHINSYRTVSLTRTKQFFWCVQCDLH